jgi:hypothetical protein
LWEREDHCDDYPACHFLKYIYELHTPFKRRIFIDLDERIFKYRLRIGRGLVLPDRELMVRLEEQWVLLDSLVLK